MMNPVPVLMFLYTNDTTEVRYSDGSLLELSPCGSSMVYHNAVSNSERKYNAKEGKVQKRTQFVTSLHRAKVLQALDFRNRFSERPYLCKELVHKDDLISLYAKIKEIAWTKDPGKANVDLLEDGSRKITSFDEYASLIVSPHCQDFTVCYLSLVSPEANKSKGSFSQELSTLRSKSTPHSSVQGSSPRGNTKGLKEAVVYPYSSHCRKFVNNQEDILTEGAQNQQDNVAVGSPCRGNVSRSQPERIPAQVMEEIMCSGIKSVNIHTSQSKETHKLPTDLSSSSCQSLDHSSLKDIDCKMTFVPITVGSPSSHELSSISRSSTPDGLRTTIDTDTSVSQDIAGDVSLTKVPEYRLRHSSPTQFTVFTSSPHNMAGGVLPPALKESVHPESAASGAHQVQTTFNNEAHSPSSPLGVENSQKPNDVSHSETIQGDQIDIDINDPNETIQNNACSDSSLKDANQQCHLDVHPQIALTTVPDSYVLTHSVEVKSTGIDQDANTKASLGQSQTSHTCEENHDESDSRSQYIWRTLHISRNCCPTEWIHPLKLALDGPVTIDSDSQAHPSPENLQTAAASSVKLDRKKCTMTTLPQPIPLTCPFHHEHKQEPPFESKLEGNRSTVGEFHRGKLKVVISEGIVYRLIQKEEMNIIEIHPGDGSVLVSQGVKAHIFVHFVLVGDQLEERTYSLKSLPPGPSKRGYCVGKLIKTAHRFLMMTTQWERRGLKEETPCWKKDVVAVVEPLSSSLLEESQVDGLGKFTAFSSGRVRVVFEDRVALDAHCDFSKRLGESWQPVRKVPMPHSGQSVASQLFSNMPGRLMLPSGEYVSVDLHNPGCYRKYVEAAAEWAAWVNSSPLERQEFYNKHHIPSAMKRAAEHELKKIFCFNYILDHSGFCSTEPGQSSHKATAREVSPSPVSSRLSAQNSPRDNPSQGDHATVCQTLSHGREAAGSSPTHLVVGRENVRRRDHSDRSENIIQGFQSVRQALLQTSSMIDDIDSFLQTSKNL